MLPNHLLLLEHFLSIASFLLTVVFISLLLRSRKPPGSTFAWLIVITAIPYAGIPLYLLFSGRKIRRRLTLPLKKANLFAAKKPFDQTPESAKRVERILIAAGGPPKRDQCHVQFLETGEQVYQTLMEMITSAKQSIQIEIFIFGRDSVSTQIQKALAKRAQEGVQVEVLVDAFGSSWMQRRVQNPSFKELEAAGGKVAYFMPLFSFPLRGWGNLRNHRKMILVDGREAIIGGMNLTQEYLGPLPDPNRWTDLSIKIQGSAVQDLQAIFLSDWNFTVETEAKEPCEILTQGPFFPTTIDSNAQLQITAGGPDVPSDPIYDALLSAIFQARQRIWIATPYFIPDDALTKALELASKRGVQVRILVPATSNHWIADFSRGSFIRQLQGAGVEIFLFPRMIHAKAIVFDDEYAFTGSANIDLRSLLLNYEVGAFVYSKNEINQTSRWFEGIFAQSQMGYPEAGFFRELAEGVGRLFSPFL